MRSILLAVVLALGGCATTGALDDFTTDGCSLYPDGGCVRSGGWAECCIEHDRAYWRGGTADERRAADVALRECVARTGRPRMAALMYAGARAGGLPLWPTWFRWGYGWDYGRGYAPLTAAEQQQAASTLAARPAPACEVE